MDYWNIYKDVWNFHKKDTDVKEDDAYWEAVVNESKQIAKQYDECKFVMIHPAALSAMARCRAAA